VPQLPRRPLGRIDTRDQGQRAAEATDGLAKLTGLAHGGEQVALVAADLHLPDGDGVESLERAAGLHNGVARILLFDLDEFHTRILFRELPALQRASALGRIDGWMVKGWVNPEEWLYPQVQEALSAWSTAHQPGHVVYRMIGLRELAHRAWQQATLLGAEFIFTNRATALTAEGDHHVLTLDGGGQVAGRAVILAAGVTYRHLDIPELDRLIGAGVFYGAAGVMAPAVAGEDVYVVGGANSAGQAALHLAKHAAHVTLLIRGASLAAGMSDYLVRQIQATPNVAVRLHTRVVGGRGDTRLEGLTLQDDQGQQEELAAAAVFIMIGAKPHTDWLAPVLSLDKNGFVLTGRDIPGAHWVLEREPYPFETSRPGVFAAGDVRHGSVKRVAGAVGEGSIAVGSVHRYLAAAAPFEGQARA
jgi:thioredoxin reductase/CheY-like chemotaxis protein